MANDMEKELRKVNTAIEYLAKLQDSYSDKTFNLGKNGFKKGSKEYKIAIRKQAAAKDQALKTWANWSGSNSYLQVLHDKDIGLMSHGGKMPGARGTLGIGTLKDWTIGQQNFTLNSDGTKYKTGHVSGMLSPSAALEALRSDQAWVVNALGQGRLTKEMYENMPYAVRHLSGSNAIEKEFGSFWSLGIPNTLQPGHRGRWIGSEGKVNPFYNEDFVKYDYDTASTTKSVRGFLGIGRRNITTKGTIDYNIPDHKFFTNHFGDSKFKGVSANSNDGTGAAVTKDREYRNQLRSINTIRTDGGGFYGRNDNVLRADGSSTSLSINTSDRRWGNADPGEMLGVMPRRLREQYDREVLKIKK